MERKKEIFNVYTFCLITFWWYFHTEYWQKKKFKCDAKSTKFFFCNRFFPIDYERKESSFSGCWWWKIYFFSYKILLFFFFFSSHIGFFLIPESLNEWNINICYNDYQLSTIQSHRQNFCMNQNFDFDFRWNNFRHKKNCIDHFDYFVVVVVFFPLKYSIHSTRTLKTH